MRLGLLCGLGPESANDGYESALGQIDEADRLGLDFVLFEEHHGARGCPAVGSLVTAAAARTSAIRVGAANRQLTLEYPTNVAEDFAVADIISRGRVVLGVSPGERKAEFDAAGVSWDDREESFREAVELVRTLWTQGAVQYVGEHYQFPLEVEGQPGWRRQPYTPPFVDQWRRGQAKPDYLPMLPRPVQWPHPPIWVTGWKRDTIEWAATRGLGFRCSSLETDDEVRTKIGWYSDALEAAGRDRTEVDVALTREVFLAADGDEARERALPALRDHVAAIRAEAIDEQADLAIMSDLDEQALLDRCFLVGTPFDVLDRIKSLQADSGVTHLACRVWLPGREHFETLECIRLLASQLHTRLVA
ncbi:MAG: LLM class flavin-dependent oxidoreductase [Acidimicrobiia bacterium]|nr:LLM class flavin-dependent oxidoreductase [Acidimicrobiia bacterium]